MPALRRLKCCPKCVKVIYYLILQTMNYISQAALHAVDESPANQPPVDALSHFYCALLLNTNSKCLVIRELSYLVFFTPELNLKWTEISYFKEDNM